MFEMDWINTGKQCVARIAKVESFILDLGQLLRTARYEAVPAFFVRLDKHCKGNYALL